MPRSPHWGSELSEVNAMEPVRFLNLPNTENSNKILSKYGASVVKADQPPASEATLVIGYPLHPSVPRR